MGAWLDADGVCGAISPSASHRNPVAAHCSLIVFTLPRLIPGDVVALMLQEKQYAKDLEECAPSSASTAPARAVHGVSGRAGAATSGCRCGRTARAPEIGERCVTLDWRSSPPCSRCSSPCHRPPLRARQTRSPTPPPASPSWASVPGSGSPPYPRLRPPSVGLAPLTLHGIHEGPVGPVHQLLVPPPSSGSPPARSCDDARHATEVLRQITCARRGRRGSPSAGAHQARAAQRDHPVVTLLGTQLPRSSAPQ